MESLGNRSTESQSFADLLVSKTITISVGSHPNRKDFNVHPQLLAAKSTYFLDVLNENPRPIHICFPDEDAECFGAVLEWVYTGHLPELKRPARIVLPQAPPEVGQMELRIPAHALSQLSPQVEHVLLEVVRDTAAIEPGYSFRAPVEAVWPAIAEAFSTVNAKSIDLSTMEAKLQRHEYVTFGDFNYDLRLLQSIHAKFHGTRHERARAAQATGVLIRRQFHERYLARPTQAIAQPPTQALSFADATIIDFTTSIIHLVALAAKYQFSGLADQLFDSMIKLHLEEHAMLSPAMIGLIYSTTSAGSRLRLYASRQFAWFSLHPHTPSLFPDPISRTSILVGLIEAYDDLLMDVYVILRGKYTTEIADPRKASACEYHLHAVGENCSSNSRK